MSKAATLALVGIERGEGVVSGVQKVTQYIESQENRLAAANTIITGLGGRSENQSDRARIIAKTMVAQVMGHKAPDQAVARAKADKMLADEPYLARDKIAAEAGAEKVDAKPTKTGRRKGSRNEKHAMADAFVEANKDKFTDRGDFTRALAAHLGTNYAGAYFYMKRAEDKFGVKLTARKGRKPKAVVAE